VAQAHSRSQTSWHLWYGHQPTSPCDRWCSRSTHTITVELPGQARAVCSQEHGDEWSDRGDGLEDIIEPARRLHASGRQRPARLGSNCAAHGLHLIGKFHLRSPCQPPQRLPVRPIAANVPVPVDATLPIPSCQARRNAAVFIRRPDGERDGQPRQIPHGAGPFGVIVHGGYGSREGGA
jgi:hypothetical protein